MCLGHQAIGQAFGAKVVRAKRMMHGKLSPILHDGLGVYSDLTNPFIATRYHSLVIDPATLPACLEVSAQTPDGVIMGVRHKTFAVEGVQFHPESVLTKEGKTLLVNFEGHKAMKALLKHILEGNALTRQEAELSMDLILEGQSQPEQLAAFLAAVQVRGAIREELVGFLASLKKHAEPLPPIDKPLFDICGTGGDGAGTFNVSTATALLLAGCGIAVAKHGNRSVSSQCGSADVVEALGINVDATPDQTAEHIARHDFGFLFCSPLP